MNPPRVIEVGDLVLVPGHEPSDGVLSLKKYPLITYEKALLGQATGGKFPSVTFLERKKMSTKTSFKRIALVAASALAIAGFSAVPAANAAVGTATVPMWINAATTLVPTDDLVTAVAAGQSGISYTKGIITGSVTALTVPIGTAVTFGVKSTGGTWGNNDILDFSLNGTIVQSAVADAGAVTTNNTVYTFAKAGTFAGNIKAYQTGTDRVSATATFDMPVTITVTAASAFSAPLSSALIRGDNTAAVATTTTDALAVSGTAVNTGTSHVAALTILQELL